MYGKIPDRRHRFIVFVGDGFLLGAACGSAFHFIRSLCISPNGGRLAGGAHAVRTNAPRLASSMGTYSALFCSFETAISVARRREDPWSSIAAGAASMGLLNMHQGAAAAARYALVDAIIIVVGLGLGWTVSERHSRLISRRETRCISIYQGPEPYGPRSTAPRVSAGGSIEHN